ncbi:MAG: hypothetical protein M1358_11910 [Chloroflexi bacterium]|nr:hypothetical protein [Chloroflexota bacterium]
MALVIFLIVLRYPPDIAGMFSLPILIGSSFLSRNHENWLLPKPIFLGLAAAVQSWVPIAAITAGVGMLIGALEISGLAVFVACGLSGAKVRAIGWEALKLGIAIYVVPFAFAFDQSLLLQGPPEKVVVSIVTALTGAVTVAAGIRGYALRPLNPVQRVAAVVAGPCSPPPTFPCRLWDWHWSRSCSSGRSERRWWWPRPRLPITKYLILSTCSGRKERGG